MEQSASSQLALLSAADYQAGLDRIAAAIQAAEQLGEQIVFPTNIDLLLTAGRKPATT